jgi:hypothetical protein
VNHISIFTEIGFEHCHEVRWFRIDATLPLPPPLFLKAVKIEIIN